MPGRLLEPEERRRFVQYCRENAESNDIIAKQLESMNLGGFARDKRSKAAAYMIVANDLDSVEDMSVQSNIGGVT